MLSIISEHLSRLNFMGQSDRCVWPVSLRPLNIKKTGFGGVLGGRSGQRARRLQAAMFSCVTDEFLH